jgi:nucleoside-diphosphate-sugar epimerase
VQEYFVMVRTALVTGGAGFIGSHLVGRLLADGWQVRVLDNFSSGSDCNLRAFLPDVEVIEGDVRDGERCQAAARGADTVFHLAAIASVASSVADPLTSHQVNVGGTLNVLMAARDQGVRRLVFSSSASVYGNAVEVPTREDQPLDPESPYATGKRCGELYCRNFFQLYGLETVSLRYFNVFGPRQSAVSGYAAVIPEFVRAVVAGERPVVYGDGRQTRDFVFVENVVAANVRAALADKVAGEVFNIAGGSSISLLDLLGELGRLSGTPCVPEFRPGRAGEVRHSRADVTRATTLLGYQPAVSFGAGLQLTLAAARAADPAEAESLAAVA